jgi:hypothetical protein
MARRSKSRQPADPRTAHVQSLAENPRLLLSDPGPSTKREKIADHVLTDGVQRYGNSAEYLVARIARDRPDVLERMKAGEFQTVWAAAREAEVIKTHTSLDTLRRAWQQATPKEREQFLEEIGSLINDDVRNR